MFKKGIFTISIDTELAWGSFDHGGHIKYRDAYRQTRSIITGILELFKKYEISATWAIVGHLFLDRCNKENGRLHPDIVRPKHQWFQGDWFKHDPAGDIFQYDSWYGSDIVETIKQARPRQEIASHSFCHPVFSDAGCSRETAESDIARCVSLAERAGLSLKSFVFPRNSPGHLDMLSKYGFKVFRAKDDVYCAKDVAPKIVKKMYFLLSDMIASVPPVVLPEVLSDRALVGIPSSMLFRFAHGVSKFIPKGARFKKAKKGIDRAIGESKIFHLWFHPISFAWKKQELLNELEEILAYANSRKEKLDILTLNQIGETFLHHE